jgi:hypothetical protein
VSYVDGQMEKIDKRKVEKDDKRKDNIEKGSHIEK